MERSFANAIPLTVKLFSLHLRRLCILAHPNALVKPKFSEISRCFVDNPVDNPSFSTKSYGKFCAASLLTGIYESGERVFG
jgi:hypothetical protein